MKILVLNPNWAPEHTLIRLLAKHEVSVLLTTTSEEAWLVLQMQGATLDLCIVNRELKRTQSITGSNDRGLSFIPQVKQFSSQKTLPVILTSDEWGAAEFNEHHKTRHHADAYVSTHCTDDTLIDVIRPFLKDLASKTQQKIIPQAPPAATAPAEDYEVLKIYLMLREKDVLLLSGQIRDLNKELFEANQCLRHERLKNIETEFCLKEERQKNKDLEYEKKQATESVQNELNQQQFLKRMDEPKTIAPETDKYEEKSVFILKRRSTASN